MRPELVTYSLLLFSFVLLHVHIQMLVGLGPSSPTGIAVLASNFPLRAFQIVCCRSSPQLVMHGRSLILTAF